MPSIKQSGFMRKYNCAQSCPKLVQIVPTHAQSILVQRLMLKCVTEFVLGLTKIQF